MGFRRCFAAMGLAAGVMFLGGTLNDVVPGNIVEVYAADRVEVGDYTYEISDGTAKLYKYNGHSSSITLPTGFSSGGMWYSLNQISDYAFENCTSLQYVTIPSSYVKIGNGAFRNCTNLTKVTIKGDVGDCSNLSTSSNYTAKESVFYNTGTNVNNMTVEFAEGVTVVPSKMFATGYDKELNAYCHVKKVIIPSTVKEIRGSVFERCYDLDTLVLSNGLTEIGRYAFFDCNIKTFTAPNSLAKIGEAAFLNNYSLNEVYLGTGMKSLGECAFRNCTSLSKVTISSDIGNISSFSTSSNYTETTSVFYNTGTNATSMTVEFLGGVTRIPSYLFATGRDRSENVYCHLTKVIIPSTVKTIGRSAFEKCCDLKSLPLVEGLTTIEEYAFYASGLTAFTAPNTLATIGEGAFADNDKLTKLVLGKNVVSLGEVAFKGCKVLANIVINSNIGDISSFSASRNYTDSTSVFYNTGTNASSMTIEFGSKVTRIPEYIFATGKDKSENVYCHVTKIILPYSMKEIGKAAFNDCYDLKSILSGKDLSLIATGENNDVLNTCAVSYRVIPFNDVNASAYYASSVRFVYEKGIMNGTSATTFSPSNNLKRGQFITILWNMEGQPKVLRGTNFSDVSSKKYYAPAIKWARVVGIVSGYGDNTFAPEQPINRQEMISMLRNYAKYKSIDTTVTTTKAYYKCSDYNQVSSAAKTAMQWAVQEGIITKLMPRDYTTRGQIAVVIANFVSKMLTPAV